MKTDVDDSKNTATTVFLSHDSCNVKEALLRIEKLKKEHPNKNAFLSSDWESLSNGGYWIQEIVHALKICAEFEALVFGSQDFRHLWMSFELGVALGASALRSPTKTPIARDIRVTCDPSIQPPDSRISPIGDWSANASTENPPSTAPSSGFYLSHTLPATDLAAKFAECIRHIDGARRPVTTRSDHWKLSGSHCLNSVAAIQASNNFFALIDVGCDDIGGKFDGASPWLNFEVGVAIGLGRTPVIFVHDYYLDKKAVGLPLQAIFLLRTCDTNRWVRTFRSLGLDVEGEQMKANLAWLFKQWNPDTSPRDLGPKRTDLPPYPPADETKKVRDPIAVPNSDQD